ncbi:hypothetical protein ASNER_137 [Candidatus Uzinura diaspidicola str. ASNER]|uniref:DUF4295 domain-containing protein n=1 Tax=Candidatus Uzinura diaspidicola str. ASNER TaxID=1133592 RepID=L7VMW4_9FLAO|nr:hypothetical protein ASNER_137 [Candidatus Uzinura diaspidicola str. ASNER]
MIKNIQKSPDNLTKKRTRVIRMIKSQKSKTYFFEEKIVIADHINNFFQRKSK